MDDFNKNLQDIKSDNQSNQDKSDLTASTKEEAILSAFGSQPEKAGDTVNESISAPASEFEAELESLKQSQDTNPLLDPLSNDLPLKQQEKTQSSPVNNQSPRAKKEKAIFFTLLILTFLVSATLGVYLLLSEQQGSLPTVDTGIDLEAEVEKVFSAPNTLSELSVKYPPGTNFPEGIQEKYKAAFAGNKNFAGWLRVPNTCIDTGIYKTNNNSYYLKRDIYGSYTKFGTPFLDYKNDIKNLNRNTVIYGHNFEDNFEDDLIFGPIEQYRDVEFYKTAPVIEFNTIYEDYKWKVFACFLTNGDSKGDNDYLFYYVAPSMNDSNFMEFIDEVEQRSYIHTGVDIKETDKILTLSTCTYFFDRGGAIRNARCVVMARLVREGESEEVDTSLAKANENIRFPQLYYNVFGGTNPYRNASRWYPSE